MEDSSFYFRVIGVVLMQVIRGFCYLARIYVITVWAPLTASFQIEGCVKTSSTYKNVVLFLPRSQQLLYLNYLRFYVFRLFVFIYMQHFCIWCTNS